MVCSMHAKLFITQHIEEGPWYGTHSVSTRACLWWKARGYGCREKEKWDRWRRLICRRIYPYVRLEWSWNLFWSLSFKSSSSSSSGRQQASKQACKRAINTVLVFSFSSFSSLSLSLSRSTRQLAFIRSCVCVRFVTCFMINFSLNFRRPVSHSSIYPFILLAHLHDSRA